MQLNYDLMKMNCVKGEKNCYIQNSVFKIGLVHINVRADYGTGGTCEVVVGGGPSTMKTLIYIYIYISLRFTIIISHGTK